MHSHLIALTGLVFIEKEMTAFKYYGFGVLFCFVLPIKADVLS